MSRVKEMLLKVHPIASKTDKTVFESWFDWVAYHGLTSVVQDLDGNLLSICMARPVSSLEDAVSNHYTVDREGSFVYVDFAWCRHEKAWPMIFDDFKKKIGIREWIGFCRSQKHGHLRKYKMSQFMERFYGRR